MTNSDSKTYIVNDQATETDALDFTPYVETLADIIQTGNTPLTIGVFGTWGSGKTSLMKMIKKHLPSDFTIAWFDAWKYDKEESLWRAFLLCVLTALKERASLQGKPVEEFEKLQSLIYRDMEIEKVGGVTIDLSKLGGVTAKGLAQLSLSFIPGLSALTKLVEELQSGAAKSVDEATAAIRRERTKIYIEQIQFLEQFQSRFRELVQEHVKPNRFVVFVDDLDRCLPEKAIGVLEAIKLFLDVENCVFVLGLDQEVIARGIEMKYKELGANQEGDSQPHFTVEGVRYLEKIIQLPFQIPPVEQADMGDFVQKLSTDWPHEECPKVFAEGLGDNPRQIKRTVNTFLMLWKLADKRKAKIQERIKPVRLAKVVAIQFVYPDLYNLLLKDEPRYLGELERYYRAATLGQESISVYEKRGIRTVGESRSVSQKEQIEGQSAEKFEPPPALVPFLSRRGAAAVQRILTLHKPEMKDANFVGLSPEELKLYFTLTRRAEAPQATSPAEPTGLVFEPQMIRMATGKFSMGATPEQIAMAIKEGADKEWVQNEAPPHIVELSEYFIGKYPTTNREYQAFVRDKKYAPPRGWDGDQFPAEKGGHPVVNVSWDDAYSYCEWLSEKTGQKYRLPTEAEWEKAARGEDGRIWPWGNEFGNKNANTHEEKIGDTTPVGQFSPQGDSPYGCSDMIGNVWEWCDDWFSGYEVNIRGSKVLKDPKGPIKGNTRVIRGGSFNDLRRLARCTSRVRSGPSGFNISRGFRVAYSPMKLESSDLKS
ncbi:MAG TPA: SUMF1/EgtB/PvdO family nonheme iron enzyme [Anaerolineales bacterium]|nr:SUMF1/EgtB/PvdO family nonheme iron enzyme [Anaerolineales bacterium]